jgi:drug/metabolite transporter (DMT)-like permease
VVKLGDGLELTTASMIFWRNFISLCIILPWILWSSSVPKIEQTLHTKGWRLHWIRGGASFASVFLYFWSLQFLSLSSATALFNTIPIFVPIVVYLWLKIPIHHNLWWALGTAFCGILLVVQPGVGIFHWASLVALGAGIFGAIASVALRIGHYSETPKTLMAYLFGICLLLSIPCTLFSFDQSFGNFSWEQFKIYLPLGIFGFGFQFLWTFAARFAPMRLLSPFLYLAVIFGMIFDRTIWNIAINGLQLLGFCLIVIGIILMIFLYPKQTQKR